MNLPPIPLRLFTFAIGAGILWWPITQADDVIGAYYAGIVTVIAGLVARRPHRPGGGWDNPGPVSPDPDPGGITLPAPVYPPVSVPAREVSDLTADALITTWATTPVNGSADVDAVTPEGDPR